MSSELVETKNNELLQVEQRPQNVLLTKIEETSFDVVEKISNLTLLTANDEKALADSKKFILSTYTDVPEYRPLVIKMASVLNDLQFPTSDAKYWQCKKEAEVHFNQLITELYKLEKARVDIEEMDYVIASQEKAITSNLKDVDPIKLQFEIRRLRIQREEYIFNSKRIEKSIKFRIREIVEWAAISNSLEKSCKYNTSNYNEHIAENLYKSLQLKIDQCTNEEDKKNFIAQLNTLKSLLIQTNQK